MRLVAFHKRLIYENEKGENVMKSIRKSTFVVLSTILLTACGSVQLHGDYDSPQAAIEDFDANYAEAISEHQSYSDEMAGKTVVVKATEDSDESNLGNKFFIIYSKGDIEVQLWDVDHAQFSDGKDYLLTIEHIDKIQTGGIKQYHIVCDAIEQ